MPESRRAPGGAVGVSAPHETEPKSRPLTSPVQRQGCRNMAEGLVAMVVQLNDSGQVVQKVSSKSKGNVNIDCIYKVLKSRSFERRTSGLIEVKYQAKW